MHSELFSINIASLKKGDKKVYESIYNEFFDVLYYLAYQYLNRDELAEEVVQDSFVKLWENRLSLEDNTNIKNLLYTITKNSCLNHLRSQKVFAKYADSVKAMEIQFQYDALKKLGDDTIIFEELQQKIATAINNLPEEIRVVFNMSRFEDLKYREIAEQLSISVKTVEARMTKALNLLRKDLKEYLPIVLIITKLL